MLSWALLFLIVAIIAGALGFSGIAGTATNTAWILPRFARKGNARVRFGPGRLASELAVCA